MLKFQKRQQPVVSVDTKKKELVGEFKNAGQEWQPKGEPERVNVHDFPDKRLGKAIPYGVYDLASNEGWVSVGIDHDTARFATASILRWWREMGSQRFPKAAEVMITADGGGSNSSRNRLWKVSLQDLANELGLRLHVCHFPPGTSKWNKIEHRLFCFITKNWRGRPLTSYEVIVNLIGNTTTKAGLTVRADLDTSAYETGIGVSDLKKSAKFYEQVAGMTTSTMDMGQGEYTLFHAGDQMVGMLNGLVIIETVFGFPGIGKLMIEAVTSRDFPVVQAAILVTAIAIFSLFIIIGLIYIALDPRIRRT